MRSGVEKSVFQVEGVTPAEGLSQERSEAHSRKQKKVSVAGRERAEALVVFSVTGLYRVIIV